MNEWLRDREADFMQAKAELEDGSRRLYGQASRTSQEALARTASKLRDLANGGRPQVSQAPPTPGPGRRSSSAGARSPQRPGVRAVGGPPARDWDQQILENARRITAEAQRRVEASLRRIADSEPVRKTAGDVARVAGNLTGIGTGALQTAEDLKDGAVLFGRLLDVTEPWRVPRGEAAWDQVAGGVTRVVDYGAKAIADPRAARQDIIAQGRRARRELDPSATRAASTLGGEVRRNFAVGRNQGELLTEGAGWVLGAGELKAAARIGAMSKAERVAKHLDQGFSEAKAAHLAEPYVGKGHHAIIPERARLPEFLGGGSVPRWILDSEFNKLHPNGISRGEFYELHSRVDPYFYGAGFPPRMGTGGWSAKRLGIEKYGLPGRVYYGTPGPTKAVVGGAAVAGGGYLNETIDGEGRQ